MCIFSEIANASYEADEVVKAKKYENLNAEVLPFYLEKLDDLAKENNGHLALGQLTWADLFFVGLLDYLNFMAKVDLTSKHPNLKAVVDNVNALPQIKAWLQKRPQTDV